MPSNKPSVRLDHDAMAMVQDAVQDAKKERGEVISYNQAVSGLVRDGAKYRATKRGRKAGGR